MHRGRSDTAANANANSDALQNFASEFWPPNLKEKTANHALRIKSLAIVDGFAIEIARNFCSRRRKPLRMDVCDKIR